MTPGEGLPLWRRIHAVLSRDIAQGRFAPGDRLPSEAALAARFGVNRHTLRRALALLSEEGAIHVRRGAGAVVTGAPLAYPLGRQTRFGANLARAGRVGTHHWLRLETERADAETARHLGLSPGAPVHVAESLGLADGVPVVHGAGRFPAGRFPGLPEALLRTGSISAALAEAGAGDYVRAWTRLTARTVEEPMAGHLRLRPGAAVLSTLSLDVDRDGVPVELGRSVFAGDRVELLVEG